MADMNLEDIMYRVEHKDSKMTRQGLNNSLQNVKNQMQTNSHNFLEKEKYLF